jgi:hypothetical protein
LRKKPSDSSWFDWLVSIFGRSGSLRFEVELFVERQPASTNSKQGLTSSTRQRPEIFLGSQSVRVITPVKTTIDRRDDFISR